MKFFARSCAIALVFATILAASRAQAEAPTAAPDRFSHFMSFGRFSGFKRSTGAAKGVVVLESPEIAVPVDWNELVPSWNADAPEGSWIEFEVRVIYPDETTRYYHLGIWAAVAPDRPRQSVKGQKDQHGKVDTDTLIMTRRGGKVQVRITQHPGAQGKKPRLQFLGLSFCDTAAKPEPRPANRGVWGTILNVPEKSQNSYPDEQGWCSPTSLSMVMNYWSSRLRRDDLAKDVPEIVPCVYDRNWGGTGNWPFNTAYVGQFKGMRAYVTRFSDITELEAWIGKGIPVIMSAKWHLLLPGRRNTGSGHIVACVGFTETGDVAINDPGTNLKKGGRVLHIYKREDVIKAWATSNNTVYLIYPESADIPANEWGHWAGISKR